MTSGITRVVALGASNLTVSLQTAVSTARGAWGPSVEVLAAAGYGRSYGAMSRIAGRTLPSILQSGLWQELERLDRAPTRAVIMDVGNDIPYGFSPSQILSWVEDATDRLLAHTSDITITDLPLASVKRLSPAKFRFFRSLFFPTCRLSRDEAFARVDEVNAGLIRLAASRHLRLLPLRSEWYGFDPIHFRPAFWGEAWNEILVGQGASVPGPRFSPAEWTRLHTLPPEKRWLLGFEGGTQQRGRKLRRGARLWLY